MYRRLWQRANLIRKPFEKLNQDDKEILADFLEEYEKLFFSLQDYGNQFYEIYGWEESSEEDGWRKSIDKEREELKKMRRPLDNSISNELNL